jgi:hypothetical protein
VGYSYVTEDKVFCVTRPSTPDAIREHARLAGLPADRFTVGTVIDPRTGKSHERRGRRRRAAPVLGESRPDGPCSMIEPYSA